MTTFVCSYQVCLYNNLTICDGRYFSLKGRSRFTFKLSILQDGSRLIFFTLIVVYPTESSSIYLFRLPCHFYLVIEQQVKMWSKNPASPWKNSGNKIFGTVIPGAKSLEVKLPTEKELGLKQLTENSLGLK